MIALRAGCTSCPKTREVNRARLPSLPLDTYPLAAARAFASTGDVTEALRRASTFTGDTKAFYRTQVLALAARWQGDAALPPEAQALLQRLIDEARPAP